MRNEEEVIQAFVKYTDIDRELIFSDNRMEHVRHARHLLCFILREKCHMSSYALAKKFGRTRRNIVRWLSLVRNSMGLYKDVKTEYDKIIQEIEGAV